jgi:hypothetical protein
MALMEKPSKRKVRPYRGLSLEIDPETIDFTGALNQNLGDIPRYLLVKNRDRHLKGCQVRLEALEYQFGDEWIPPPNGFEHKALRWAEGSGSQDGVRDISANSSTKLEIVRLFRFPNPFFGISYFDGNHGKTHHFLGTYRLRLSIGAQLSDTAGFLEIEPQIFEVVLRYAGALDLRIEDITRVSAA